mmetsp:Transcript_80167/g.192300  ORF Transcript_80167/g.192300 Transcript_80167/m.192300 type:complete len:221 (-) Transcript_80167:1854-2516(-)
MGVSEAALPAFRRQMRRRCGLWWGKPHAAFRELWLITVRRIIIHTLLPHGIDGLMNTGELLGQPLGGLGSLNSDCRLYHPQQLLGVTDRGRVRASAVQHELYHLLEGHHITSALQVFVEHLEHVRKNHHVDLYACQDPSNLGVSQVALEVLLRNWCFGIVPKQLHLVADAPCHIADDQAFLLRACDGPDRLHQAAHQHVHHRHCNEENVCQAHDVQEHAR